MARMAGIAKATPPAIRQAITPLPAAIMAAHRGMFRVAPRLLACLAAVTAEITITVVTVGIMTMAGPHRVVIGTAVVAVATTAALRPVVIGTAVVAVVTMAALRPVVIGTAVVAVATTVAPRPVVIGTAVVAVATTVAPRPVGSNIIA